MAPISITLEEQDPAVAVVALIGEHDAFSARRLESELAHLIDSGLRVVVDLREASFIDSATISALLGSRHDAEQAELGFTLVLDSEEHTQVNRILSITGLDSTFAVYRTTGLATAAARAGRTADHTLKIP